MRCIHSRLCRPGALDWQPPASFVIDRARRLAYDGWVHEGAVGTDEPLKRVVHPLLVP
jgi:hypothetical protein